MQKNNMVNTHSITDYRNGFNLGRYDLRRGVDRSTYILKTRKATDKKSFIMGYLNSQGRSIKNFKSDFLL